MGSITVLGRWLDCLWELNLTLLYCPGGDLIPAHWLSRLLFPGDTYKTGGANKDEKEGRVQEFVKPRSEGIAEAQLYDKNF